MTIRYQKLTREDIPIIREIGRATYAPYYPEIWHPGGIDWYMERCFGNDVLEQELSDPNYEYFFPRDENGGIIGLLKLVLQKPVPGKEVENALYLEKIYLMPAFFGKGVGLALMEFVFQKAASLGREAVWLMVLKAGPVNAYLRAGFEIIGETRWEFDLLKEEQQGGWVMLRVL